MFLHLLHAPFQKSSHLPTNEETTFLINYVKCQFLPIIAESKTVIEGQFEDLDDDDDEEVFVVGRGEPSKNSGGEPSKEAPNSGDNGDG